MTRLSIRFFLLAPLLLVVSLGGHGWLVFAAIGVFGAGLLIMALDLIRTALR